jgi:hypothetical protein
VIIVIIEKKTIGFQRQIRNGKRKWWRMRICRMSKMMTEKEEENIGMKLRKEKQRFLTAQFSMRFDFVVDRLSNILVQQVVEDHRLFSKKKSKRNVRWLRFSYFIVRLRQWMITFPRFTHRSQSMTI